MKLSVIIPCFNGAKTIGVQLEALANQQWTEPWEVITSDNGSTDETVAVAERYKKLLPNLRIVDASDRRGGAHARNVGALAAVGDTLAFCDQDDEVGSGWLAAIGEALSKHDFVVGPLDFKKLNEPWLHHFREEITKLQQFEYPPHMKYGGLCNLGCKSFVHQTLGGFDESFRFVDDMDFCWRAQLAGIELHWVSNAVVHYRLRHKSMDIYSQARNWSEETVLLHKMYGEPSDKLTTVKSILRGLRTQYISNPLRIHSRKLFAQWLWGLGWKVGRVQGCIKYVL